MAIKFEHEGIFTLGYYNSMEAGFPVFIDGESIDDLFKEWLTDQGISNNFCEPTPLDEGPPSPLVGKRVRFTIEVLEEK